MAALKWLFLNFCANADGLEIACDNAERVRGAFALDCCDREAMSHVVTTAGIKGEYIRDLMVAAVEQRVGRLNQLSKTIEWLTDDGSCYTAAETRRSAHDIGFLPLCTPIESPQSNGMAEAFVRTFKRDYVAFSPKPDAATVILSLPSLFGIRPTSAVGEDQAAEAARVSDRQFQRSQSCSLEAEWSLKRRRA
jgi:putative transposase